MAIWPFETCSHCLGTGVIVIPCSNCHGTGKCPKCSNLAEKKFPCPYCYQTGKVNCPDCRGSGKKEICPFCRGGSKNCDPRGGYAIINDPSCPVCSGDAAPCPRCQKTGKIECRTCSGTGLVNICPICHGKLICQSCYNHPYKEFQCSECYGKGKYIASSARILAGLFIFCLIVFIALKYLRSKPNLPPEVIAKQFESLTFDNDKCNSYHPEETETLLETLRNPEISNQCLAQGFFNFIRTNVDNNRYSEEEQRLFFKLNILLPLWQEENEIYLVDNQAIVQIPKTIFSTRQESLLKSVAYEINKIKEYFRNLFGIHFDNYFYYIKVFTNQSRLIGLMDLAEGSQAVTISCRYIAMPLNVQGSVTQKQDELWAQTLRHELMHAVLCVIAGTELFSHLPQWVIEGSASFYAEETPDPELLAFDKKTMTMITMPYARRCYLRVFEQNHDSVFSLIKRRVSAGEIKALAKQDTCREERQKCSSDCRKKLPEIMQYQLTSPIRDDSIDLGKEMENAYQCERKCDEIEL